MTIGRLYMIGLLLSTPIVFIVLLGLSYGDNKPAGLVVFLIAVVVFSFKKLLKFFHKKTRH